MRDYLLSYREVIPDQTVTETWNEIILNTGGTQSTLQDIKVAERANGYCYRNALKHHTRNRFIYWRISHDVLELVEQSLDMNLTDCRVRYKFTDTPILDGITIHETYGSVVILVPTVCSVHRLIFPHPDRLYKQDEFLSSHPDIAVPSIFTAASSSIASDPNCFYVINNPTTVNSVLPHAAASLLTMGEEDALFALAYPSGEIIIVRQAVSGQVTVTELKQETIVPRLLSAVTNVFRSKMSDGNVVVSMLMHSVGLETYAFTFCRDGNLRVWSCTKGQCVGISNVITETVDRSRNLVQGSQSHQLRKFEDDSQFNLIVFLSFSTECQFHILQPTLNGGTCRIDRVRTLYSPTRDLIDFSVGNNRIWALWREEDGECSVFSAQLNNKIDDCSEWIPSILETTPDAGQLPGDTDVDPKQDYLQYIFHPGRFPLSVISKALSIYRRSAILSEVNVSSAVLKQKVCLAVEAEIQSELIECEVGDDEYLESAYRCWSKFHSCCVQYHVAGLRPLGLLQLPSVSALVLLKKSMYSFMRPLHPVEHLMLCNDYCQVEHFGDGTRLPEDKSVFEDIIKLMKTIVGLDQYLNDKFKYDFSKSLSLLYSPDVAITELMTDVLADFDDMFLDRLIDDISSYTDLYQAMHGLLEILHKENNFDVNAPVFNKNLQASVNHLFSSQLGISVVSQCLYQQALVRFTICHNLLVIVNILLQKMEQEWSSLEAIRSVCLPEIVLLTQASYAFLWICEIPALPTVPMERSMQRLSTLKLAPVFNLKANAMQTFSLLELFAASTGGTYAHKAFAKLTYDEESLSNWHTSLLPLVSLFGHYVWALSGNVVLGEWLLTSGQNVRLQQYVRLLNTWCERMSHSRVFLLAVSLLNRGEHLKAKDLFLNAAKGVFTDQYLVDKIVSPGRENESQLLSNYYLKVIQLFELHGARMCAIDIATMTLSISEPNSIHIPMLHNVQFLHHLALGHYDKAYNSLNANPDIVGRKDNLRNFVKTLLDRKQLDTLMSFPYAGMEQDFVTILYTRARATDSVYNVYYDFLYSYEIKRGSYKQAAHAMYEQAFRLSQHSTVDALEKQVKCYLASINALHLVASEFAWVVKPTDPDMEDIIVKLPVAAGSDDEPVIWKIKNQVEVLELKEIEKEMALSSARLRLARFDLKSLTNQLRTPNELVAVLTSVGMFKTAILISVLYKLPYGPVFEALTRKCVKLTRRNKTSAWKWLVSNDLADMPYVENNPAAVAWKLLQNFLEEYEEPFMSEIHKVICLKIISMSAHIPNWLMVSYKKTNPSELLRILYFGGRLHEATRLAVDFLKAAMGLGKEHFGLKFSLMPNSPPLCLPVNIMEILIYELKAQNENCAEEKPFEQEYNQLADIFKKYLELSTRISTEAFH